METAEKRRFKYIEESDEPESNANGLFGSILRVVGVTLAVFESRVELFTVELKELKGRALALIFWGFALLFLGFMTFVAIMGTVVFLLWNHAASVLAGFSGFFLVLAIGSFLMARSKLKKTPLNETVDQLRKDRELVEERFS